MKPDITSSQSKVAPQCDTLLTPHGQFTKKCHTQVPYPKPYTPLVIAGKSLEQVEAVPQQGAEAQESHD